MNCLLYKGMKLYLFLLVVVNVSYIIFLFQHNHFPGISGIAFKPHIVELHTKFDFIPKGYCLPADRDELIKDVSVAFLVLLTMSQSISPT